MKAFIALVIAGLITLGGGSSAYAQTNTPTQTPTLTPTRTATRTPTSTPTMTPTSTYAPLTAAVISRSTLNVQLGYVACDSDVGQRFSNSSREVLVVRNDSASPSTVTVHSVTHPTTGATADIVQAVAAGTERMFGPFKRSQYSQRSGSIGNVLVTFSAEDPALLCAVAQLPVP